MIETDLQSYSLEDLEDAASKVDRTKYPARAAALDAQLKNRRAGEATFRMLLDARCGARLDWVYYEYPFARIRIYDDRISIRTITEKSQVIEAKFIVNAELSREIALKWIQIRHQQPNAPEVAVWLPRKDRVLDLIQQIAGAAS